MAVEVAIEKYYFTPEPSEAVMDQLVIGPTQEAPFVYNPLHDIESLWWVLLWVVLCKVPSKRPPDDQDMIRNYCNNVLQVFPQRLGEGQRGILIKLHPLTFARDFTEYMMPAMHSYLGRLLRMKVLLTRSYAKAEAGLPGGDINPAAWLTIHQEVIQEIDRVLADPKCVKLTLSPLATALQNVMKHKKARVER